jgi:aryl carrier-like protein
MDLLRWWRRSTADVDEERKLYEAYMAAYDAWWEAVSGRPRTTR